MSIEQNELNDEHPLVLELSSLRQTAARFQHEAHQAALKLQRYTLAAAQTNARLHFLESQHSLLASELATLRAHSLPPPNSQSDIHVVQELTLALRRSSEKLDLTEHALAERAAELVNILNEAHRARHDAEGAYKLAASARAREEEGKVRERGLATRLQATEEERRLIELVVHEYADLVRSLDGRKSSLGNGSAVLQNASASASSLTLFEGLHEGKTSLHRLMTEFASENEKSETTITQLRNDIATLESILDAERKTAAQDRAQLAKAQLDLEILKLDDTTAAKMVSRYMKFSQSQTNALQSTLTTLQTRHISTQHTLQSTINDTEARMHAHIAENARLRDALEELGEEVTREAYGRRREVALRLALLAREEALGEALRRWVRRAQEGIHRCTDADSQMYATLERVVKDAESLLMALDAEVVLEDGSKVPGVLGRLVLAKDAVMRMSEEVGVEVGRRVAAERRLSLGMVSLDETAHEQTVSVEGIPVDVTEGPTHTQDVKTDIPHTQDETPACPQVPTPPPSLPVGGNKDTEGTPSPIIRDITPGTSQLLRELPIELSQSPAVSILDLTQTPTAEAACILPPSAEPRTPLASANELTMEHDTEGISDTRDTQSLVQTPTPPSSLPAEVQRDTEGAPSTVIPNIMSGSSQMLFDLPIEPTGEAVCTLPSSAELRTPLASANQLTIEHDADEIPDTKDTTSPLSLTTPAKQKENPTNQFLERNEDSGIFFSPAAATPEIKANEPNNLIATTIPSSQPPSIPNELLSLLSSLNKVKCRYDGLQYAFRDCSLALKDLKRVLPPVTITSSSPPIPTPSPQSLLRTALDRISDYTEDARVELEIRITDEALAIRGFETLLTVPGALCLSSDLDSNLEEMRAFVEGTDEGVRRARERLEGKLGDVQHDVAVVKRAVHELQVQVDEVEEKNEGDKDSEHKSWSAWTSNLLPRSSTPTPTQTPTFGSVMTSPRLNRAPSEKQLFSLAELELRIPMPLPASVSPPQPGYGGLGLGAGVTPGLGRQRTMSMMYSLGIGSRASTSVSSLVMPGMSPVKSGGSRGRFVTTPLAGQTHGDRDESDVE